MSTLRLRESQLQKHSNVIQEHKEILNEKENLIVALRYSIVIKLKSVRTVNYCHGMFKSKY